MSQQLDDNFIDALLNNKQFMSKLIYRLAGAVSFHDTEFKQIKKDFLAAAQCKLQNEIDEKVDFLQKNALAGLELDNNYNLKSRIENKVKKLDEDWIEETVKGVIVEVISDHIKSSLQEKINITLDLSDIFKTEDPPYWEGY